MKRNPPFSDESKRREILCRLNQIPGIELPADNIDKYPSFDLAVLADEQVRNQFLNVIEWAVDRIKGDPE